MRVALVGQYSDDLLPLARELEFEVVEADQDPEVIVAYGGDGSLIGAEARWPGIPKMGLRSSRSCEKCELHDDRKVMARLAQGEAPKTELMKLQAQISGQRFLGVNDILMRNRDLRSAVRFSVHVNDERATDEIIGDGLVVSTPFGSSAYFRSITNTTFRQGIGLAFNNCTEFLNHLVLLEDDVVRVEVSRGPASLTADNEPAVAEVSSNETIIIQRSDETATVLSLDTLRCPMCRYKHAPRRRF